jgi:class 3 adenylate cyclase/tetratricopeptide (TPR) repeat protein
VLLRHGVSIRLSCQANFGPRLDCGPQQVLSCRWRSGLSRTDTTELQGTQTILFTDLEASTDLRVRLGDAAANEVFSEHDQVVRSLIEAGGGKDIKGLGDGFMALFTSANRAIETAVSIQRAIETHNAADPARAISVRMGLNSGDVTYAEGDVQGTAVHAASRIASKAQGDQILISQIVSDVAGSLGTTKVVDRGLFWLKGFPERWRLYEVLWREKDDQGGRIEPAVRAASTEAFDPSSPRSESLIVGRKRELKIIEEHLTAAKAGLRAVVLEGEAGIGKTRMLEETVELAHNATTPGCLTLDVAADEELRGPFLLFRSLLGSPRMAAIARDAMALEPVDRARDAVGGRSTDIGENLSPQERMLRIFDDVASAVAALTRERPVALLFDDLQWADDDSIQLIRYLVRTLPSAPIFLLITVRPYSESSSGADKLIADLDRMRVTQVLRLERFTRPETAELLQNLLGSPVDDQTLQSLHARSEGVPFFIEELARAYREADALQLMDGSWTMTRLSGTAVPSSVQSLIERRLSQLPDDCRGRLADAGVLGRRFKLSDLAPVVARLMSEGQKQEWELAEELDMAVQLGLINEEPEESEYDFSFSHDQIRASLLADLPRRRQQAIHGTIAELLASRESVTDLSMLAYHSMKAGDSKKAVSSALEASQAALEASAPEEAIRIIDATLPAASEPTDRITMLRFKDDALRVLDRGADRIANLAEMSALAGAVASPELATEVKLRRASASRLVEEFDSAVELASEVRETAVAQGDASLELEACLELGQAVTRSEIGEAYWPLGEVDVDAADEAYTRALDLARETGARTEEAIALRELAVIEAGRVRKTILAMEEDGTSRFEILAMGPSLFVGTKELAEQAFKIFEEIGDQRGAMSALISMAYSHITDPTAHGMAGRIEHIRALHNSRTGQVTDSQRAKEDALMLYSIHTYARLFIQPDLALQRGQEGFERARALGDRWLEALTAGGMSLTHAALGAEAEASAWLDRAATAATSVPSTAMARRLEMWRGACSAARGESVDVQEHFERAAELAGTKNPAGRAEAYCALAIETCKLGAAAGDSGLLEQAAEAANRTLEASDSLGGQLPWESVAHAVLAVVADSQDRRDDAEEEARIAISTLDGLTHLLHFVNVLWAAGRVLIDHEAPEADDLAYQIAQGLGYLSMNMIDLETRGRWFAVDTHRELAQLAGFELSEDFEPTQGSTDLDEHELALLREITSGGEQRETDEAAVTALLAKLGVGSEIEVIEYAIKAGIQWR